MATEHWMQLWVELMCWVFKKHVNISCPTYQDSLDSLLYGNSFFTDQHESLFCVFSAHIVCWLYYESQAEGLYTFGCKKALSVHPVDLKGFLVVRGLTKCSFFSHSILLKQTPDFFLFRDNLWTIAEKLQKTNRSDDSGINRRCFSWRNTSGATVVQQILARHVTNILPVWISHSTHPSIL